MWKEASTLAHGQELGEGDKIQPLSLSVLRWSRSAYHSLIERVSLSCSEGSQNCKGAEKGETLQSLLS